MDSSGKKRLQRRGYPRGNKKLGYTSGRSMLRYYIQPKREMRPSKKTVLRFETQPG